MAGVRESDWSLNTRGTHRPSGRGRTYERRRDIHANTAYRRRESRGRSNSGPRRRPVARPNRQQGELGVLSHSSRNNEQNHWDYLEELHQKCASEIVASLSVNTDRFEHLLEKVSCKSIDLNVKILDVMNRALQSESVPKLLLKLLNIVKKSNILTRLINKVPDTVLETADDYQEITRQIKELLSCLLRIFEKSPSDIVFICGIDKVAGEMKDHIETVLSLHTDISEVQALFEKMDSFVKHCLTKHERQHEKCDIADVTTMERSFKDISVFPTTEDMIADNIQLPVNKIFGRYENCEQYLDTHFKLLREDFISPMREGIKSYFGYSGKNQKQLRDVRCYENVQILSTVPLDGINHLVSFDISKFRNFRWGLGSRLKFGSLLCFSQDNFQSCYFATVAGSSPRDLCKGQLTVKFNESIEAIQMLFGCNLLMVESTAYFEAYRHVLNALHGFSEDDLPFARYIVECEKSVLPPVYLRQNPKTTYDLSYLLKDEEFLSDDEYLPAYRETKVATQWPGTDETDLNESQLNAVKLALTKEFSLIQGPPGCGKTFVGLKIAKLLLQNMTSCKMLIVCYTNHALDQFLEGITTFGMSGIVRVGGRSKNEKLKKYNLKTIRLQNRKEKRNPKCVWRLKKEIYDETQELKYKLKSKALRQQVINEHIVHERTLRHAMGYNVYRQFRMQSGTRKLHWLQHRSALVEWLGVDEIFSRLCGTMNDIGVIGLIEYYGNREQDPEEEEEGEGYKDNMEKQLQDDIEDFKRRNLAIDFDSMLSASGYTEKQKWRTIILQLRQEVHIRMCKARTENPLESDTPNFFINSLSNEQRWNLYCRWVSLLSRDFDNECLGLEEEYNTTCEQLNEANAQENTFILQEARVIGMTTTCAARIRPILKEIKPKIIIIEEAAEVLEAHVTSTLTKDCEHLILIGDHKQLRPKPSVYRLETDFNLGISMFERLVRNKIEYRALNVQHRMRPEIANLIRFVYPDLQDHETACQYDQIKGIKHNVFFVSHNHAESQGTDIAGYHSAHEAEYMLVLCKYLIKQGYKSSQITILTAYKGQFSELRRRAENEDDIAEVAIKVIDDYQGEENDIILLSFVRSNERGKAGFLKESNRICVALSRAKVGLFAIGDFDMYSNSTELWQKIVNHLKVQNKIGKALPLQCQNHPNNEPLLVETADDFKNAPDGGCTRPCDYRLECGHVCKRRCHPYDREHMDYRCMERCYKTCANNHHCTRLCSDVCRCYELIVKHLDCGHEINVPCGNENDLIECTEMCTKTLPCGHECTRKCKECCDTCRVDVEIKFPDCGHSLKTLCFLKDIPCTYRCQETLKCGHTCRAKCSSASNKAGTMLTNLQRCKEGHTVSCQERCKKILACGHRCSGTCNDCHSNGFHTLCAKECKCTLICGHECKGKCQSCELCTQRCDRKCVHGRLGGICKEECRRCQEPCPWVCSHLRCTKKCGEPCDRPRCNEPCMIQLPCKHTCSGLCGDPCPPVCVKCDAAEVAVFKDHDRQSNIAVVQLDDCGHLIQQELMDQYIDSEDSCVLKKCLVCSKIIYTTNGNRYEHDLNRTFANIDSIKRGLPLFSDNYNRHGVHGYNTTHCLNLRINGLNREILFLFLKHMSSEATDLLERRISLVGSFGDQIITDVVEYLNSATEANLVSASDSGQIRACESLHKIDKQRLFIFRKKIVPCDLDSPGAFSVFNEPLTEIVNHEIKKMDAVTGKLICAKLEEHDYVETASSLSSVARSTGRDTQEEVNDDAVEETCTKLSQNEGVSILLQKSQINHLSETEMASIEDEDGRPSPDTLGGEDLQSSLDKNSPAGSGRTVINVPYVKTTSRYFHNKPSSDVFKRFKSMTEVIKIDNKKERKRVNALETQEKSTHAVPSKRSKLSLVSSSVVTPQTSEGRTTLDTPVTPKPSEHRTKEHETLETPETSKTPAHRTEGRKTSDTIVTPKTSEHRTEGRKTSGTSRSTKPSEHRSEGCGTLDMFVTPKTSEHRTKGRTTLETPETPKQSEHHTEGRKPLDTVGTPKPSEHRTEGRDTLDMFVTPKTSQHRNEGRTTFETPETPKQPEHRTEGRKTLDTVGTPKPSEHRTEGHDTLDMFVTPKTSQHRNEGRTTFETPETPKQPEHRTEGRKTLDTVGTPKPSEHRTEGRDTLDMFVTPKTSQHLNEGRTTLETPETPKQPEHRTEGRKTLDTVGTPKPSEHRTEGRDTLDMFVTPKTSQHRNEGRTTLETPETPKQPEHRTEGRKTLDTVGTPKPSEHRTEGRDTLDMFVTPKTSQHRNKGRTTLETTETPKQPDHRTEGRKTLDTVGTPKPSVHRTEGHDLLDMSVTPKTSEHRNEGRTTLETHETPKPSEHRTKGLDTLDTSDRHKTPEHRTKGRDALDTSGRHKTQEHRAKGRETLDTSGRHKTPEHRTKGRETLHTSGRHKTPEHRTKGRKTLHTSGTHKTPEHRTEGRDTLHTSGTHKTPEHRTEERDTLHTFGRHNTSTPERQSSHHGSSHHRSRSHHRSINHRSSFHQKRDSSKIQSSEEKPLINKLHPNTQASGQDGSADVTQPVNVHELDQNDLRRMLLARRSRPLQNIWTSQSDDSPRTGSHGGDIRRVKKRTAEEAFYTDRSREQISYEEISYDNI